MSFVGELKPAIYFSRMMGVAPYKIVGRHLQLSPIAILYSIIIHFFYIYLPTRRILSRFEFSEFTDIRMILLIARSALVYSVLLGTFISSLTHHREFCAFVNKINKFDEMTNIWRVGITKKRVLFTWASVLVPISIRVFTQTYYNYAIKSTWLNWQWGSSMLYIGLGVIISQYSIMVACMLRRFQHLNSLFIPGRANTIGFRQYCRRGRRLNYAWILHADLVEVTEQLNSMFNYQSLVWLFTFGLNVITHLYVLWDRGLRMKVWELTGNSLSVVHSVLLVANFLTLSHLTAEEANEVGVTLFCSGLKIFQNDVDWTKETMFSNGQYFVLRRFSFVSAAGLLCIDLPLLQNIAGLITTYLVILKTSHSTSSKE